MNYSAPKANSSMFCDNLFIEQCEAISLLNKEMYLLNKAKQKQLAFLSAFYFTISEIMLTKRKLMYAQLKRPRLVYGCWMVSS